MAGALPSHQTREKCLFHQEPISKLQAQQLRGDKNIEAVKQVPVFQN